MVGEIDLVSGQRYKRKEKLSFGTGSLFDELKYVTLEGSSITLLGLIKYDKQSDSFEMTKLSCVLTGGLRQAQQCLAEKIKELNERKIQMAALGCLATGLTLYLLSKWLRNIWDQRNQGDLEPDYEVDAKRRLDNRLIR